MVARDGRGKRDPGPRAAVGEMAHRRSSASTRKPTPARTPRGGSPNLFTAYLRRARDDVYALSTLPPGRFLMPGDLEGSPALTFAPIALGDEAPIAPGSLAAMMARRYEAYKAHVVRPFFRDHFARLDRQIVLVDALSALNSGPAALADLENALSDVMRAFRAGRSSYLASIFRPRIDRILFAATKADHLHHTSHDRLEAILRALTAKAIARAEGVGAEIDVIALAAIRATREAEIRTGGETLDAIIGVPEKGETIGGQVFDGVAEAAVFPGELPADPDAHLQGRRDRAARGRQRLAVRPLPPAAHPARRARAADPARPGAAIPDRGPSGMKENIAPPLVLRSGAVGDASRRTLHSARPAALTGPSFETQGCALLLRMRFATQGCALLLNMTAQGLR